MQISTSTKGHAIEQSLVDRYHHDGFLSYSRVLDDELLDALRQEYDYQFHVARESGSGARNVTADRAYSEQDDEQERMLQIMNMHQRSALFNKLLYHEPILEFVRSIIGPNIMLFHDQALFKPAHDGGAVFWHQDNAYWKCRPANLISCWIALDDADADNGAMQFIPGSHLRPVWHEISAQTKALLNIEEQVNADEAVLVPLEAGACAFHHCQTMHYTAPNHSNRHRRAHVLHFMSIGTSKEDGNIIKVDHAHPVLSMQC